MSEKTEADVLRVALCQLSSGACVDSNLDVIARRVRECAAAGADLVAFPENAGQLAPEGQKLSDAEPVEGNQVQLCCELARSFNVGVLLGSFSELSSDPDRVYNTSVLIDRNGRVIATYRKIHLFDVDVDADTQFCESDTVLPGEPEPVVADFEGWRIAMTICYDLRFPELYRAASDAGADILAVPAAFTARTGAVHWEVLLRARAIENQAWVIAPAQCGHHFGRRESWGHSMVVDPWGTVVAQRGASEGVVFADIVRRDLAAARARIPALTHRRLR